MNKGQHPPVVVSLSVAVITKNEEHRLPACLIGLTFADEVVIVDGGSTDDTVAVAESFGCRVFREPWRGFAAQKQLAVDRCRNDWVLILDADERVPPETAAVLSRLPAEDDGRFDVYGFCRENRFHGKWIKTCGWWPDRVLRLVDRRRGRFSDSWVHETWETRGRVRQTDFRIIHESFRSYADIIGKMRDYSLLGAKDLHSRGRSAWSVSPVTHGLWMFFRSYILERGVLDGFDGLVIGGGV